MITNEEIIYSPRMGGEVHRYHTWPTIRTQTVADHTFNVIRIYWHLFGSVPAEVTAYLIFHDIPEMVVGDPPHPIKLHNPPLKAIYDDLEGAALAEMLGEGEAMDVLTSVTDEERVRMKACDLLEMAEFAAIEIGLGNKFANAIIVKVFAALQVFAISEADMARVMSYYSTHILRFTHD